MRTGSGPLERPGNHRKKFVTANLQSIVGGASPESRASAVETLRAYADAIESGRCVDFVAVFVCDDEFQYRRWSTKMNAIALTAMAHRAAVDEIRT